MYFNTVAPDTVLTLTKEKNAMTQGREKTVQIRCPRCGGLMRKPQGSNLYWHADNDHPRCDITNIIETALEIQSTTESPEPPSEPPAKGRRRK
jgi:ssDNA-binding Zn-finger/Zn-ribbon topoisomerase 1